MSVGAESLEIQLPPQTLQLLHQEAERRAISVTELICEAIELLLAQDQQARLQAAEALCQVEAPVADWETMKRELEEARRV
jgi:hypothetical protein